MESKYPKSDFLGVALAARRRGFEWVIPVDDKSPLLRHWNRFSMSSTETELRLLAKEFPDREVGVVLKGHAGSVFVWDIDQPGVLERMERETGRTLPETYVVRSRPETAPYKQHVYFRQTEKFASLFPKQVNANGYDIKGMGGGHVVAEGCSRRDTGEVRSGNGLTVVDIPDWLTNWLHGDRLSHRRVLPEKNIKVAKPVSTSLVPVGRRTAFLQSRAKWFVRLNMEREAVYAELLRQCRVYCEGGVAQVKSTSGRRKIRAIAFNPALREGDPTYAPRHRVVTAHVGTKIIHHDPKAERMERVARLPDSMTSRDAYQALGLNPRDRADQMKLSRAMNEGGFVRRGGRRDETLWVRLTTQSDTCVVKKTGDSARPTKTPRRKPSQSVGRYNPTAPIYVCV
jgi:Bifunctional DNA primase/polymerase, N-terminal